MDQSRLTRKPNVLLFDEHPIVREGLRRIAETGGFGIVAVAKDAYALVEGAATLELDLIVFGISCPGVDAVETTQEIRTRNPNVRLLMMLTVTNGAYIDEIRQAGATSCIPKSASIAELTDAMWKMVEDRIDRPRHAEVHNLTVRQREVLKLIAAGKTAREIATVLNISARTSEFHKTRLMEILHLRTTAELTRYAIQHEIAY
jgi:DNA-binding NarL/FixJ family response regulator